jgi:hypothetical protein
MRGEEMTPSERFARDLLTEIKLMRARAGSQKLQVQALWVSPRGETLEVFQIGWPSPQLIRLGLVNEEGVCTYAVSYYASVQLELRPSPRGEDPKPTRRLGFTLDDDGRTELSADLVEP